MASSHLLLTLQQSSSSLRLLLSPSRLHYSSYPSTFSTCSSGRSFSCVVVVSEQTSCRSSSSSSSSSSCIAAAAAVGESDGEEQQEEEVPQIISRNQFKLTPRSSSSRRRILLSSSTGTVAVAAFLLASGSISPPSANARERRNRKEIPVENFQTSGNNIFPFSPQKICQKIPLKNYDPHNIWKEVDFSSLQHHLLSVQRIPPFVHVRRSRIPT